MCDTRVSLSEFVKAVAVVQGAGSVEADCTANDLGIGVSSKLSGPMSGQSRTDALPTNVGLALPVPVTSQPQERPVIGLVQGCR